MNKELDPCIYCGEPADGLICSDRCQREHFGMGLSDNDRQELESHIEELRGDIRIAVHLGNLTIAGNLKESLAKAEKDLAA